VQLQLRGKETRSQWEKSASRGGRSRICQR